MGKMRFRFDVAKLGSRTRGSIGTKIGLGFAAVVLLIALLGVSVFFVLRASDRNLYNIEVANKSLLLAMQIENAFAEGSAGASMFIAYGDEKDYKRAANVLSEVVVLEHQFDNLVPADKKPEVQKLIQLTARYTDLLLNDLPHLVRAYHGELAAGNVQRAREIKTDVSKITGNLLQAGDQASAILRELVKENRGIVEASIISSQEESRRVNVFSTAFCAAAVFAGLVLSLLLTRTVTRPLREMITGASSFACGDLRTSIAVTTDDELGELSLALNKMRDALRANVAGILHSAEQVTAAAQEMAGIADQSATAVDQISASVTAVSEDAARQMETVGSALSTVEQMSQAIGQVAANTEQAAGMSKQAATAAQAGGRTVDEVCSQMASIEEVVVRSSQVVAKLGGHSQGIGQFVETITGIAGQTNLLALNAAIEAARAGEQGKGFAVVAEEVRKLAQQAHEAAGQIGELIREIQADTADAVNAMQQGTAEVKVGSRVVVAVGESFREISRLTTEVSVQTNEISTAIHQISAGGQAIVDAVKAIDAVSMNIGRQTQTVAATTQEESAAMEQLAGASQNLAEMAAKLKGTVNTFQL
jgi:methyl-accepting chemotaxis protein